MQYPGGWGGWHMSWITRWSIRTVSSTALGKDAHTVSTTLYLKMCAAESKHETCAAPGKTVFERERENRRVRVRAIARVSQYLRLQVLIRKCTSRWRSWEFFFSTSWEGGGCNGDLVSVYSRAREDDVTYFTKCNTAISLTHTPPPPQRQPMCCWCETRVNVSTIPVRLTERVVHTTCPLGD